MQFTLYKLRCTRDIRHCVFSHRIIIQWNSLLQEIANATNTNTFKQLFDSYHENVSYVNNIL